MRQGSILRYNPQFATNPYVDKNAFDDAIKTYYGEHGNKGTRCAFWSRAYIDQVIRFLDDFKEGRARTTNHYAKDKHYYVLKINDNEKHLVNRGTPRRSPKIIMPAEDYYGALSKWHLDSNHGGRDKLQKAMRVSKHYVPVSVMYLYLNQCSKCNK